MSARSPRPIWPTGLDPKVATIFAQSAVPAHAELAWIFNCVARLGWLDRMTQFKDKAGKHKERSSVGLYTYPVLQAADILVYKATHVPVGEDQRQHLELTRDIAQKFNHDFEAPGFFPLPEALTQGPGARIMSLRDGAVKMSKSDPSDNSRINLTDDADAISQKIRKAKHRRRAAAGKARGPGRPPRGAEPGRRLCGAVGAHGAGGADRVRRPGLWQAFKPKLADLAVSVMGPIGGEMRRLLADPAEIDRILASAPSGPARSPPRRWPRSSASSATGRADALRAI